MKNIIISISLLYSLSFGGQYAVISSKNIKELSSSQIKAIFLKKSTYIGDIKAVPINLEARNKIRLNFEKNIIHMSFSRLKRYWTKQHYLGHRPPISMKSQQSIKSFVKKVDGAIGYIDMKNIDDSVKVIYKWSD